MTPELRKAIFDDIDRKGQELILCKGMDYAGEQDVLANFKVNAERLGLTKYQVWSVYFMKHIDSILNAIKRDAGNPKVSSEPLEGRVLDARNYLGLLACMLHEDKIDAIPGGQKYKYLEGQGLVKLTPREALAVEIPKHIHDFGIDLRTGLNSLRGICGVCGVSYEDAQ